MIYRVSSLHSKSAFHLSVKCCNISMLIIKLCFNCLVQKLCFNCLVQSLFSKAMASKYCYISLFVPVMVGNPETDLFSDANRFILIRLVYILTSLKSLPYSIVVPPMKKLLPWNHGKK